MVVPAKAVEPRQQVASAMHIEEKALLRG